MENGNQILPPVILNGNLLSSASGNNRQAKDKNDNSRGDAENSERNFKENARLLLNRRWENSQADNRRNNLLNQLTRHSHNVAEKRGNDEARHQKTENNFTNADKSIREFANRLENSTGKLFGNHENQFRQNSNRFERGFPDVFLRENLKNIAGQNFENLFAAAREHRDFAAFRDQPGEFWNRVRQMSAIRVVETFVKGNFEPRAVSRYGELLERLNRQGGGLERFLNSLPAAEKEVFAARYQLEKSFGANKLFVGNGVVLNERGEFSLQAFLSAGGRNSRLSAHTIISLLGGDARQISSRQTAERNSVLDFLQRNFASDELPFPQNTAFLNGGGQMLLNAASEALLGLSLALYQNAGTWLSLQNLTGQIPMPNGGRELISGQFAASRSAFETGADDAMLRRVAGNESATVAALVNGALASIEKYRKSAYESIGLWAAGEADNTRFRLSAGATGAIMSATIGCVAPLAEKSAGEALGFAASVVVGLNDGGLRAFGATALVSIVTGGVQILLNSSINNSQISGENAANNLLNAAGATDLVEDLRHNLFNRRINAFLTS